MRLVLPLLLLATPTIAPAITPAQIASIDKAARATLKATQVPAASIAVVQGGKIVYSQAYGMQSPGVAAVPGARYPIASISKQITATAILMLADEGKLSLDDAVGKYVPGLTDGDHVTIRQILSHTSGYRDYWPQDYSFADMAHPITPRRILARWAGQPLDFKPGSQWQYSNTGYVIAGQIIEKVSGQPLMTYLRRHVFQPLGMTSAVDADTGMTRADATPHNRYALGPVRVEKPAAAGWLFAAGELSMTADDLARWDIGMMDHKLLSPAGYTAQQTPVTLTDGTNSHYGLGVFVRDAGGHREIEHDGEAVGFLSENIVLPDDGIAVVVLDNADFADAQEAIAQDILKTLAPDAAKPATVAAAKAKAPPVDPGTSRAAALYAMLQAGRFDRSQFTVNGNFYFTATAIADYRARLAPLGKPTAIVARAKSLRGGFTEEVYRVTYPHRQLTIVLRAVPGRNGKVEQFTVYPAG